MDSLSHLFNEFVAPSFEPTAQDWAEYQEYLDSVGYDHGEDDRDWETCVTYALIIP